MIADIVVLTLVGLIVGAIIGYLIRQKKKGVKCIGCPAGNSACKASGHCANCPGCKGK